MAENVMIENKEPDISFFSSYVGDEETGSESNSDISNNVIINNENTVNNKITYVPTNIYMYTKVFTNIYAEDNNDAKVMAQVKKDEPIKVIGEDVRGSGLFVKVQHNGIDGFVAKQNLSTDRKFKEVKKEVLAKDGATAFSDPALKNKSRELTENEKLQVVGISADVFEIKDGDSKIYIPISKTSAESEIKINEENTIKNKEKDNKDNGLLISSGSDAEIIDLLGDDKEEEKNVKSGQWVEVNGKNSEIQYIHLEKTDNKIGTMSYNGVTGEMIVDDALQYVGNRYVWGGNSLTNGIDCSGFTKAIYAKYGYDLPRYSGDQRYSGRGVTLNEAQPGDIVCYPGHVAIYMGNESIVHASTPRGGIKTGSVYIGKRIVSIRRILN